ncbi:molybdenum cofactor biosynthesis protein B [Haloplanus sp. GCM10025708]|uniref:MogA/MoaB family molybdenum cofactor biosynthesis protein n=1 Tax=Haloferacaceae TaxID=1644056 RepID=UPI00360B63FB
MSDDRASDDRGRGDHSDDHAHGDHHTHGDHDHHAHDVSTLGVAVVTVSTSRSLDDDPSGDAIVEAATGAGHEVATRELIDDDYDGVQQTVDALSRRGDVDVVVTTGGTGVTPDDVTVEAVTPLFGKELPGFGELFRRLSYDDIGTKVIGTRAVAGVVDGTPVFCLPGSESAARLGVEELILPEAGHLAGLATRD